MAKMKIMNMAEKRFEKIFIYDFQDDGNDPQDSEQNYGMIRAWKGNESPDSAKEAYLAVSAAGRLLAGCTAGELVSNDEIWQYSFQNNRGQRVFACWHQDGQGEVIFTGLPDMVTRYDLFGNSTVLTNPGGTYAMPVNTDVSYIVYDESKLGKGELRNDQG